MSNPTGWERVAEEARQRLIAMRRYGNLAAVAQESGVSDATWRRLLEGEPVKRQDKRLQITDYLGWTPDSLDRMLAGRRPEMAAPQDFDPYAVLRRIREEIDGVLERRRA